MRLFFSTRYEGKISTHGSGCSSSVVFSNRLSRFFGSKVSRGPGCSVRAQLRPDPSEELVNEELVRCEACVGLSLGVWQEPFEWILEGVSAKSDQSHRLERVGVWAGLWRLRIGEPGSGVDVASSVDLTLRKRQSIT